MRVFFLLTIIALVSLSSDSFNQEKEIEVSKSLKILNIHDTTDAKILLA